jgi:hypothetical protein
MTEQRNAQRCNKACCLYIDAREVSKEEYTTATLGIIGTARGTAIVCLKDKINKAVANETGFYIGSPLTNSVKNSPDSFIYDTKTHAYLRIATDIDYQRLRAARKKVDGPKQEQHR